MWGNKPLTLFSMYLSTCFFISFVVPLGYAGGGPSVAIIGGGIGGTASSYFLRDLLKENVDIDVYEKTDRIGGRTDLIDVFGNGYEAGGAIIHPKNKYAGDLTVKLGLEKKPDVTSGEFTILKDKKSVFTASKWSIVTFFRVLKRYGLEVSRLRSMTRKFVDQFSKIYNLQAEGKTYLDPENLLSAASSNLANLTSSDFYTFLTDSGFSKGFIDELVSMITYVNYGQSPNIHGFVGSVAVAGADGNLWSVRGGNSGLAEALVRNSGTVHLKTAVKSIKKLDNGMYALTTTKHREGEFNTYDIVIIANPLEVSKIEFISFEKPPYEVNGRKFHRTVATIVGGILNANYTLAEGNIYTCTPDQFFTTITRIYPVKLTKAETFPVYKVFSMTPLSKRQQNRVFSKIESITVRDWLAYPEYNTVPPRMPSFVLDDNLYYVNAIEWAASAIEMSLISAKNIALMVAQKSGSWAGPSKPSHERKVKFEL